MHDMDPKILRQTDMLGWKNVKIEYFMASNYTSEILPNSIPTSGISVFVLILVTFVLVGLVGTIIELTKIGDIPWLKYD